MNDAEKNERLQQIKAEINADYETISQKHNEATKLIFDAVRFAKRIGDKLLEVKNLVGHGHYEDWVERNFNGGVSTARAYTRIARYKNWKKIAPKLNEWGGMTIEQALSFLRERGPEEEKKDKRWLKLIEHLAKRFQWRVTQWPERVVLRLAHDDEIINALEKAAKKRNREIVEAKREH